MADLPPWPRPDTAGGRAGPRPWLPTRMRRATAPLVACALLAAVATVAEAADAPPALTARAPHDGPASVVTTLLRQAAEAFAAGRYRDAANLYRAAYAADPRVFGALYGIAVAEQRAGRCGEALAAVDALLLVLPTNHELRAGCRAILRHCRRESSPAPLPTAATVSDLGAAAPPARQWPAPTAAPRRAPWALPAGIGLALSGAALWGVAGYRALTLQGARGAMLGADAAGEQRTINALSGVAVAAGVGAAVALAWHWWAQEVRP